MFTGLIETTGTIRDITIEENNKTFYIESNISHELVVDQSVSHNGVCLTVTSVQGNIHTVTAIQETLTRSTLGSFQRNDELNLERSLLPTQRLDGHIVQGHVDAVGKISDISDAHGSKIFTIEINPKYAYLIIDKGSICIDGISLTIVSCTLDSFMVAIIPHTLQVTTMKYFKVGDYVNVEFDIVGKYLSRYREVFSQSI